MHLLTDPDENGIVWQIKKCDSNHVRLTLNGTEENTWIETAALSHYPWYTTLLEWLSSLE